MGSYFTLTTFPGLPLFTGSLAPAGVIPEMAAQLANRPTNRSRLLHAGQKTNAITPQIRGRSPDMLRPVNKTN